MQMAVAAAAGVPILGKPVLRRLRVMYYVAEDTQKRVMRRMRLIAERMGVDLEKLKSGGWLVFIDATKFAPLYDETVERHESDDGKRTFFNKVMGPTADFARLSAMVKAFDPDLLFVDGASDTFAGELIKQRDVKAFLRMLMDAQPARRIGVVILVHIDRNSARGNKSEDDGYIGAAAWHNSCRRRLYLVPERDKQGRPTNHLRLEVMKNQDGPPVEDLKLYRSTETKGVIVSHDAAPVLDAMGSKADEVALRAQVEPLLALIAKYEAKGEPGRPGFTPIRDSFNGAVQNNPWDVLSVDPAFPKHVKDKAHLKELLGQALARGWLHTVEYHCTKADRKKDRLTLRDPKQGDDV